MAPPPQKRPRNTIPPAYTCAVLQLDCGGGYCCPLGTVCFDADDNTTVTCRLAPGIPGTDQPASPAIGISPSTTPTPSPSPPSSSPSPPTTTPTPTPTRSETGIETWPVPRPHTSHTPDTRLTGTGVAGVVVGVLLLAGLLGGSAWSLWRRRRRERAREDAGHASSEDVVKDFLGGASAVRREEEVERRGDNSRRQRGGKGRRSWGVLPPQQQRGWRPEMMGMGGDEAAAVGRTARGGGGDEGDGRGMVYMYGGSNVGRSPGEVPGRVEAVGDTPTTAPLPTHMVSRKPLAGQRGERPPVYEMDGSNPLARTAARGSTG